MVIQDRARGFRALGPWLGDAGQLLRRQRLASERAGESGRSDSSGGLARPSVSVVFSRSKPDHGAVPPRKPASDRRTETPVRRHKREAAD
jgi:hypothetical protein